MMFCSGTSVVGRLEGREEGVSISCVFFFFALN